MAVTVLPREISIIMGPSLMDLQEALFFNQDKELGFNSDNALCNIVIRLGGMLHQRARMPGAPDLEYWLLLGNCIKAPSPLRALVGKQVSIGYNPRQRTGMLSLDPSVTVRGQKVTW